METDKLNSAGGGSETYRPIQESDMEEQRPKSVSVEKDGADERMLPPEEKKIEAAVIVGAKNETQNRDLKANGDTKLDIGDLKSAFVGLTKEELLKYANEPVWVYTRWGLLIGFWLLWACMLGGAIFIIVQAPRCDPPPPKSWWEKGPLVEAQNNIDDDSLKALAEKGVKGIIVNWSEDAYLDFTQDQEIFKLCSMAKEHNDLKVIVTVEPSVSSVWFERSENKEPSVDDYYIWRASKGANETGNPLPPNNWLTVKNESAWIWSKIRNEFYYAPTGRPHLNFRNQNVIDEFSNILGKMIRFGVSGIRLKGVPQLLVDPKFDDELIKINAHGFHMTDYGFYSHSKTENLPQNGAVLLTWRKVVKFASTESVFMSHEHLENIESYRINGSLVLDLPIEDKIFAKDELNAVDISRGIKRTFDINGIKWPLWKYNSGGVLDFLLYLLPGAPLIDKDKPVNTGLLEFRNQDVIMRGTFEYSAIANNTVFAVVRTLSGNPAVLVAYNPTNQKVIVNFPQDLPIISEEVTVQFLSSNYIEPDITVNVKYDANNIPISPNSVIVLTYVPKPV